MTHTPGPWEAEFTKFGFQINAEMHAVATSSFCYAEEVEANGRLMAAAPELLLLLKNVLYLHKEGFLTLDDETHQDAILAIAKATGEE